MEISWPGARSRANLELGAVEVGFRRDDGRPQPFPDIDEHCALAGARRLLDREMCVLVCRHARHNATLGALYPLTPR
jgi:hypothetical protein